MRRDSPEWVSRRPKGPRWAPRVLLGAPVLLASLLGVSGCGRPATEAECREILRRAAELELKGRLDADASVIEKEVKEIESSLEDSIQKKCVGKPISEGAMACVRAAKSAEEVTSKCLR